MVLSIKYAADLRDRLARLDTASVLAEAFAKQAAVLAETVRAGLSQPPGGEHDRPWRRSGALHDSIGAVAEGQQAVVGSSDPAAVPQEMGTARLPPRPFLAPVAAQHGREAAQAIGARLAASLRGEAE